MIKKSIVEILKIKTKLLKKIRKQYSIVYYPDGMLIDERYLYHKGEYVVHKYLRSSWYVRGYSRKEQAVQAILDEVRERYGKYSRKYKKPNYKGIKVWYNK